MAVGRELLQFVSHAHPLPGAQENSPQSSLLRRWGTGEKRWKVLNKKLFLLARESRIIGRSCCLGKVGEDSRSHSGVPRALPTTSAASWGHSQASSNWTSHWGAGRAVWFVWSCGNSAFGVPIPGLLLVTCFVLSKSSSASQGLGFLTCKLGGLTRGPEIPSRSSVTP